MRRIDSADNAHFKSLRKLAQHSRERHKSARTLLDGIHLIGAYADCVGPVEELLVSDSGSVRPEIANYLAREHAATKTTRLADGLFNALAAVDTPTGIIAVVALPEVAREVDTAADSVVLDGVQDPGNVGSILRSAAAAGFRQVVVSADCAHPWSPKVLRAAMGAHFQLAIHEGLDLAEFLATYRGQSIVTALDADNSLYALSLDSPVAWVFGNEGQGVRPGVAAATRQRARIPMPGAVESLNVAAAAAICLFETVRQRLAKS